MPSCLKKRTLWLRHETKPFEERTALTPRAVRKIREAGHSVVVEESSKRAFPLEEYRASGAQIAPMNSWIHMAPDNAVIMGLKELENNDFPLVHRHIHFAHCYKGQSGSRKTLERFAKGGGLLYDLEYLIDENYKRVAAFGVWAGFTGAALGIALWTAQEQGKNFNLEAPLRPYPDSATMVEEISRRLKKVEKKPSVLIIGANGRCGQGARKLLRALDLNVTLWGSKETKSKYPLREILDYDLLINTALITSPVTPWLTHETLKEKRNLSAICDVSCDPSGPCNPLPVYNSCTTMDKPVQTICNEQKLDIIAIDHLPSLLPKESSEDFCSQLMPHLLDLLSGKTEDSPWDRALILHYLKLEELGLGNKDSSVFEAELTQRLTSE